jgi:hypothetical protein
MCSLEIKAQRLISATRTQKMTWQPSGTQQSVVSFKKTEVSEVRTVSFIKPMVEAVRTSETSVYFNTEVFPRRPSPSHI